jgi:hypothetical protein
MEHFVVGVAIILFDDTLRPSQSHRARRSHDVFIFEGRAFGRSTVPAIVHNGY